MDKLKPWERWRRHVMERFAAFRISVDFKQLRREGLSVLGRKSLLTTEEWWQDSGKRTTSDEYRKWHQKCVEKGERFGLAPWTVEMACLLKGYKPQKQPHVMEVQWPRIRVVTEYNGPLFLQWLCHHAWTLGLHVIGHRGSTETTLIHIPFPEPPERDLTDADRPPRDKAFRMDINLPPDFPPEAAAKLSSDAARLGRVLLRKLGYPVKQRMRSSNLVKRAKELKVDKRKLPSGGSYDIIDAAYSASDGGQAAASKDQERRKLVKSRRAKLKKRLVEPYEPPSE